MQIKHLALVAVLITPLSGCLDNDVERAAAGAVAGAVIADVTNGSILTGAVIGAGAGALCDDVGVCR
ncbi:MAG: YMGG-like glycine zipper-containing protein [Marinosulfonomonas sp.]|nr:YMGG-like glycine zipper-containing protein [Marinosulfonomonas sp.]